MYSPNRPRAPREEIPQDIQSATPLAMQRNWRTVGTFPACPETIGPDPLAEYAARVTPRTVFYASQFGEALVEVARKGDAVLGVVCNLPSGSVKGWALSLVTMENGKFIHEARGTYFSLEGALNVYHELLGIDAPHVETIDDYT